MGSNYRFTDFAFFPERQRLTRGGETLRVGSRALAILQLLIERRGSLVTKRDILARVWPGVEIGEESLRLNILALRRALIDTTEEPRFILTDYGRGYRFVGSVTEIPEEQGTQGQSLVPDPAAGQSAEHLPVRLTSLVARDEAILLLAGAQSEKRLLTIVGPGGIGKTSVAIAVARRVSVSYPEGAWLLDLAALDDPDLIPITLGSLLGITRSTQDPLEALLEFVRPKRMLLVLDNCEHLVSECARFATRILAAAPGVHIIATSREVLGVEDEHVYPLSPLETSSAVRLFIERAMTRRLDFSPGETERATIADICSRLDGNPLAIELAAANVEHAGVAGIAAGLDRRFRLLSRGYRTSAQRHRSLRAVMDWSYDFLPPLTQRVLLRLSVFRGSFTLEAAEEISYCSEISPWEVVEHLTSLVDKSLLASDPEHFVPQFRLLETVRAYATEKFLATGELDSGMERLAGRCRRVFGQALDKSKIGISTGLRSMYLAQVEDLRASLHWAFASQDRLQDGVQLAIAAAPTLDSLGLFMEGYQILRAAIERLEKTSSSDKDGLMQLYALVAPMSGWVSLSADGMGSASRRLLELARDTGRVDFQLSALRNLFLVALLLGQNAQAREYSIQMADVSLSSGDRYARVVAQQRVGAMCTIMGEHGAALRTFAEMAIDTHPDSPVESVRYLYEPVCIQKSYLARTLWCVGQLDLALQEAAGALERANRLAHVPTQFVTLIQAAALIPLWTGPRETAVEAVRLCNELAGDDRSLRKYARVFSACLEIKHGDAMSGTRALKEELIAPGFDINTLAPSQAVFYCVLAEGFYLAQKFDDALELVERALEQARLSAGVWFNPELLRVRACVLAARRAPVTEVESWFEAAQAAAREQQALYWELRVAYSRAQYLCSLDRQDHAQGVLQPVYEQFTQGFELAELRQARTLLHQLRGDIASTR